MSVKKLDVGTGQGIWGAETQMRNRGCGES